MLESICIAQIKGPQLMCSCLPLQVVWKRTQSSTHSHVRGFLTASCKQEKQLKECILGYPVAWLQSLLGTSRTPCLPELLPFCESVSTFTLWIPLGPESCLIYFCLLKNCFYIMKVVHSHSRKNFKQ